MNNLTLISQQDRATIDRYFEKNGKRAADFKKGARIALKPAVQESYWGGLGTSYTIVRHEAEKVFIRASGKRDAPISSISADRIVVSATRQSRASFYRAITGDKS